MMKTSPAASFVVTQAEFLFQFLVIAFGMIQPMFGLQVHQFPADQYRTAGWTASTGAGSGSPAGHSMSKPFFRMRLRAPIVAMRGTHPYGDKA